MMKAMQDVLWQKLAAYPFGPQGSELGFERRLARENDWSSDYTAGVVEEYRRFLFLAARAGHPITPSDAVDQAWHLHLIYTDEYWNVLCGEILGFPFHHGPTRGGPQEQAKYVDWYTRTLTRYEEWFGSKPRADVWPSPKDRFLGGAAFRRVNLRRVWLVPKPDPRKLWRWWAGGIGVSALTGCTALAAIDWNVLEWTGGPFLVFYGALMTLTLMTLFVTRQIRGAGASAVSVADEDPYVVAGLAGGSRSVVDAGIAALASRQLIEAHPVTPHWVGRRKGVEPGEVSRVEEALLAAMPEHGEAQLGDLRRKMKPMLAGIRQEVRQRGWEPTRGQWTGRVLIRVCVVLAVVALGVIKIGVGMADDRPVGILMGLVALTFVGGLILAFRVRRRTRAGDEALAELRLHQAEMRSTLRGPTPDPDWTVPMFIALAGGSALAGTTLARWQPTLRPAPGREAAASSGADGCGGSGWSDDRDESGDGGGSDSGGGDSGGGDGGSGCGGCGGGGD
jgi:uncharacterized protein (TIGR04222 family)